MSSRKPEHTEFVRLIQSRLGVAADGIPGPLTLAAFLELADFYDLHRTRDSEPMRDTIPTGHVPLRERALQWSIDEADRFGGQRVCETRVSEYHRGCDRKGDCVSAAVTGFAEHSSAYPGEKMPPHRASVSELRYDAMVGNRPGERWIDVSLILATIEHPPPRGALAIYDAQHSSDVSARVERVVYADAEGFRGIYFSDHFGTWFTGQKLRPYTHPDIVGFIVPDGQCR